VADLRLKAEEVEVPSMEIVYEWKAVSSHADAVGCIIWLMPGGEDTRGAPYEIRFYPGR
jgi:hypothetical protein